MPELFVAPPEEITHILKVGWGMSPQYTLNQVFSKLTLIFLYHRVFSVDEVFVRWLYGLGIAQIAWAIPTYVVKWNLCSPIEYTWDKSVPGGTCINIGPFLAATEAFNSLIDFAMIGLAIWIVQTLRMSTANKWKLAVLFSIGGLSGVIGFIKIGEAYSAACKMRPPYTSRCSSRTAADVRRNLQDNNIRSPLWDVIQMATSIICCCAPVYKPLILELGIVKALRSTFGSSGGGSGSRSYSKSKPPTPPRWNGKKWTGRSSLSESAGSGGGGHHHQPWLRIGGSSKEELAWTAEVYGASGANNNQDENAPAYPLRTMEVRQTVEIV